MHHFTIAVLCLRQIERLTDENLDLSQQLEDAQMTIAQLQRDKNVRRRNCAAISACRCRGGVVTCCWTSLALLVATLMQMLDTAGHERSANERQLKADIAALHDA